MCIVTYVYHLWLHPPPLAKFICRCHVDVTYTLRAWCTCFRISVVVIVKFSQRCNLLRAKHVQKICYCEAGSRVLDEKIKFSVTLVTERRSRCNSSHDEWPFLKSFLVDLKKIRAKQSMSLMNKSFVLESRAFAIRPLSRPLSAPPLLY